jgi:hypothetical protein
MNISHPSEKEIQQFALDRTSVTAAITAHIEQCAHCREEVSTYQLLFSGIAQQPAPAFDFDLSALILPQLPVARKPLSADHLVGGFLVLFVCFCVAVPVYIFRQYFLYMFSGISAFFVYAMLCSAILIILYKSINMYKKYQQQMRLINFS